MYCSTNYQTKKAMVEDVKNGVAVRVVSNSPFNNQTEGTVCLEGPHYPQAHKWYATVFIKEGFVVKVRS
jgi:hypothetical protein